MENKIGSVIHTDKRSFELAKNAWKNVMPAIEKISDSYNSLGMEKFSQQVFNDIIENGVKNILINYRAAVESDIKKIGAKTMAATMDPGDKINQNIRQLNLLVEDMKEIKFRSEISLMTTATTLYFEDCIIEKSKPVLNIEQLEKKYQVVLTDIRAKAYGYLSEIQKLANEFRSFVDSNTNLERGQCQILDGTSTIIKDCFLYEDRDGKIQINTEFLEVLR